MELKVWVREEAGVGVQVTVAGYGRRGRVGVPFTDPHAAVTVERLGSQLLGVVKVAQEEGRSPDSHRPGIARVANLCCSVGVHVAEQDAAGFVAVTGPCGFVADGGEGGFADPNAVNSLGVHGRSQVGQPGIGGLASSHLISPALWRSNGAAQPG